MADKRSELLSAAVHVFARRGYDGASLQEIADIAGVRQPLIHYHFGSKESLWQASVDFVFSKLDSAFQTISRAAYDLEPIDQIRVLVRVLLQFVVQEPDLPLILLNETRDPGPRLDWLVDKYIRKTNKPLSEMLEGARAKGQIRDLHPLHFTNTVLSTISQLCIAKPLYEALYGPEVIKAEMASDHAEHLIRILLEGIKT
jgi:TetR/AcrR family transcriptional regulator